MQDFSVRHATSIRPSRDMPKSAAPEAFPKKPPSFSRSTDIDGGRSSNFRHDLVNCTRRLFGRREQPSVTERAEQAAFLEWRSSQLAAFANAAHSGAALPQTRQTQARPAYVQVNHQATQVAMEESWRQWRVNNPGVAHQVGNQPDVSATYF